ncbi:Uncharacterised protein [Mannheimia haemolytica]|uniref:Uncharacterized protein n=1 Tax=Mannheimia haemolytica TaxID=75985 RepID=A0A378MVG9_MANHA|nr:Uncharacterised protein [Mannheimia haemolytica]
MMAQVSTLVPHFLQKGTSVDACTIVISEMTGTLYAHFQQRQIQKPARTKRGELNALRQTVLSDPIFTQPIISLPKQAYLMTQTA